MLRRPSPTLAPAVVAAAAVLALAGAASAAPKPAPSAAAPYSGLKKTVAVESFQSGDSTGGMTTGEGLSAMLGDALASDGRFVLVERPALGSVVSEQTLGSGGSTSPETGARHGELIGASYLVRGTVTKFDAAHGGSSFSVAGLGMKSQKAYVEISIRVIDSNTGEVVFTGKADGEAASRDLNVSYTTRNGTNFTSDKFKSTPLGVAAEAAIHKIVASIDVGLERAPWSALVVDNSDGKVIINAGAAQNVAPGVTLRAFRRGRVLTDPGTGQVLDVEMAPVGTLRVGEVREKISTASVVDGQPPQRGDILRR